RLVELLQIRPGEHTVDRHDRPGQRKHRDVVRGAEYQVGTFPSDRRHDEQVAQLFGLSIEQVYHPVRVTSVVIPDHFLKKLPLSPDLLMPDGDVNPAILLPATGEDGACQEKSEYQNEAFHGLFAVLVRCVRTFNGEACQETFAGIVVWINLEEPLGCPPRLVDPAHEGICPAQIVERLLVFRIEGYRPAQMLDRFFVLTSPQQDTADHRLSGRALLQVIRGFEIGQWPVVTTMLDQVVSR